MLNEKGLEQVHPLSGGIEAWHARRYPVERRVPAPSGIRPVDEPAREGARAE
jgi:3-mercaptopyruvate sulfurtransferase SseA